MAVSNGTVALLNGRTLAPVGKPFVVITGRATAESVAFSPDGALLATGADDGSLRLFDVADPAHPRQVARVRDSGADAGLHGGVRAGWHDDGRGQR